MTAAVPKIMDITAYVVADMLSGLSLIPSQEIKKKMEFNMFEQHLVDIADNQIRQITFGVSS
jgi:hypothetical protein